MSEQNNEQGIHAQIDDELDKALLNKIKSGNATASDLNVARLRLKDLGISKKITTGSHAQKLTEACGLQVPAFRSSGLPPVSEEEEAV